MNTKYKALLLTLCVILLVSAAVFGTVAYFTDTEAATNTFVVGKVGISLDEAKVNENGKPVDKDGNVVADLATAERVKGNAYHLVPGYIYTKDPTVTVEKGSSESYVRMIVTVTFKEPLGRDALSMDLDSIFTGYNKEMWPRANKNVSIELNTITYEYRYKSKVTGDKTVDKALEPLFTAIQVPGEFTNEQMKIVADMTINVEAHAIQAAGFDTADAAWAAFAQQHPQ